MGEARAVATDSAWSDIATLFCSITPLTGDERIEAGKIIAGVSHNIETRYRGDIPIVAKNRLAFGARTFEIGAVLNVDERSKMISMLCRENQ